MLSTLSDKREMVIVVRHEQQGFHNSLLDNLVALTNTTMMLLFCRQVCFPKQEAQSDKIPSNQQRREVSKYKSLLLYLNGFFRYLYLYL